MATCDVCGKSVSMPYNCRHCGGTHCSEHRLPENHNCSGLQDWNDPGGVFNSGFDESVDGADASTTERIMAKLPIDTGPGGPLAYFRGNVTYTILLFMWVALLAQWITLAVAGARLHQTLFVLSSWNLEYGWTWITSIFAHSPGNIMHIVFNSIVIFFFGPIVERYLGSRDFAVLFIGSGILAGLGQVGLAASMGNPTAVLGASGAALAIMGVLTILNPNLRVYFMFFIPMPLWILTIGFAGISLLLVSGGAGTLGNIAHGAHLIGLLVGFAVGEYVKRTRNIGKPNQVQLGGGGGPGGPGGPGRGRGPF